MWLDEHYFYQTYLKYITYIIFIMHQSQYTTYIPVKNILFYDLLFKFKDDFQIRISTFYTTFFFQVKDDFYINIFYFQNL